jgi:hypothetical protein
VFAKFEIERVNFKPLFNEPRNSNIRNAPKGAPFTLFFFAPFTLWYLCTKDKCHNLTTLSSVDIFWSTSYAKVLTLRGAQIF